MTITTMTTDSEAWAGSHVDLRISVDPVLFTHHHDRLHVLLRRRAWRPFLGMWALPGAINPPGEQIEETMWRELRSLGFSPDLWVEQLKTFDRPPQSIGGVTFPGRDPRGRVVSVAYFATVPVCEVPERCRPVQSTTRSDQRGIGEIEGVATEDDLAWMALDALPDLAFDHREIVDYALMRLRNKIQYAPVAFELLPPEFTLTELQEVYEAVLGVSLDKRNFRRKVLNEKIVLSTASFSRREKRPARLYRSNDRHFSYSPRAARSQSPDQTPRVARQTLAAAG
jgi:8-oxo-dGTP diphosphatase